MNIHERIKKMSENNWTRIVKVVESDKLVSKMNKIMQSLDEIGVDNVAYAFTELAQEMRLPVDQVLTDRQYKLLKKQGML